jgi:3-deoxy-D-manno-octulosonate 8-phosphate phosphatase (KDO 8-P phosphatase)
MDSLNEELKNIKAFVFDVDGVLSLDTTPLAENGDPVRTANVKDGFAIRHALRQGFEIAIITGGAVERVRLRYQKLGVKHYYEDVNDKTGCLNDFFEKAGLASENVMYMGDDLVDLPVMKMVGVAVCPADATEEIKNISKYISEKRGGEGCVRDVIEMVLKAQDKWMDSDIFFNRSF